MYGRFIGECAWKQHVCEGEDSKREKLAADFTGSSLESFQIEVARVSKEAEIQMKDNSGLE